MVEVTNLIKKVVDCMDQMQMQMSQISRQLGTKQLEGQTSATPVIRSSHQVYLQTQSDTTAGKYMN